MASKWAKTFVKNLVAIEAMPSNEDELAELVDAVREKAPVLAWEQMEGLGSDVMMHKLLGEDGVEKRAIIYINDADEVKRFAAIVEAEE